LYSQTEYKRYNKEDFSDEMKMLIICYVVKANDLDDEIVLEALDKGRNVYRILAKFSENFWDGEGKEIGVQMFSGMMICVQGTYIDEELQIEKIVQSKFFFSIETFKFFHQKLIFIEPFKKPNQSATLTPLSSSNFISILAFNGPYSYSDSPLFTTFKNIQTIISTQSPSILILNGPFYSKNSKTISDSNYLDKQKNVHTIDYKNHRYQQIQKFVAEIQKRCPATKILIMPDIDEVDILYPIPIPNTVFGNNQFGLKGQIVAPSPCLFSIDNFDLNIGYIGGDVVFDTLKKSQVKNVKFRIENTVKLILGQNNFWPVFPSLRPIDLSKAHLMSYGGNVEPDVLFTKSATKRFLEVIDGVLCVNFGSSAGKKVPGVYAKVMVDIEGLRGARDGSVSDFARAEILGL